MGFRRIAGVDEAGRGALFGPVVAASVILDPDRRPSSEIRDSKTLGEAKREGLFDEVIRCASAWAVCAIPSSEIDEINILQATLKAMEKAVSGLVPPPDRVLVDGNVLPRLQCPGQAIVHGDALSVSIAAASIVAKVWRDRKIRKLSEGFPGYGLERNKGYATREHLQALRDLGSTPHHRKTFRGVPEAVVSAPDKSPALQPGLFAHGKGGGGDDAARSPRRPGKQ